MANVNIELNAPRHSLRARDTYPTCVSSSTSFVKTRPIESVLGDSFFAGFTAQPRGREYLRDKARSRLPDDSRLVTRRFREEPRKWTEGNRMSDGKEMYLGKALWKSSEH